MNVLFVISGNLSTTPGENIVVLMYARLASISAETYLQLPSIRYAMSSHISPLLVVYVSVIAGAPPFMHQLGILLGKIFLDSVPRVNYCRPNFLRVSLAVESEIDGHRGK